MSRVHLLQIDPALGTILEEGADRFETTYRLALRGNAGVVREVVRQTLAMPSAVPPPWGGYLGVDADAARVIGTCGFKAAPTSEGTVEIAYFTFAEFEGRGYATAMALELIALATSFPLVRRILAHTLPEPNASTRILQKVGMRYVGEVFDPEDGRVWQWELLPTAA